MCALLTQTGDDDEEAARRRKAERTPRGSVWVFAVGARVICSAESLGVDKHGVSTS